MAENNKYQSQAKITTIRATSRQSVKIHDQFYTIEYTEERLLPDNDLVDIKQERLILWNVVNNECDNQILEVEKMWREYDEEVRNKMHK